MMDSHAAREICIERPMFAAGADEYDKSHTQSPPLLRSELSACDLQSKEFFACDTRPKDVPKAAHTLKRQAALDLARHHHKAAMHMMGFRKMERIES